MKSNLKMQSSIINKTMEEGYKEFTLYCIVKNLSQITIKGYDQCFRRFSEIFPKDNLASSLNKKVVDSYIADLRSRKGLCEVSVATMIRGLRVILYYFMSMEYIPNFIIQVGRAEKTIKETYTDDELNLLLKKPDIKKCDFAEYRTWVLINYLLATGNRVTTILNVKIKDLDLESGIVLLCKTKNKKQQVIPLSRTLIRVLDEYLKYRKGESEEYLFCSSSGKQININGLTSSVRRYNKRRGVLKTSIHLFRHTFAKKWILSGGDIFRLQKVLGHSSLEIVKEYVNMFNDDLKQDFDHFNPLEQMTANNVNIKMR